MKSFGSSSHEIHVESPSLYLDVTSLPHNSAINFPTTLAFSICSDYRNLDTNKSVSSVTHPGSLCVEVHPNPETVFVKSKPEARAEVFIPETDCCIQPKQEEMLEDIKLEETGGETISELGTNQFPGATTSGPLMVVTRRRGALRTADVLGPDRPVPPPAATASGEPSSATEKLQCVFCPECGKAFQQQSALVTHRRLHTGELPFRCSECGKGFAQSCNLKQHMNLHTGKQPYSCVECGNGFPRRTSLMRHMRLHTGGVLLSGHLPPVTSTAPSMVVTRSRGVLKTADALVPDDRCVSQPPASASCAPSSAPEKQQMGRFCCPECGKVFQHQSHLVIHRRVHTGERPFRCSVCCKGFTQNTNFKRHMRVHTGERPFHCSECGKDFALNANFKQHMRVHTGERPFRCSECGKCFTQNIDLKRHMRMHTGERPFRCSECGKGFMQNIVLKRHMQVHTGERPFRCSECGKGLASKANLEQHMRAHTGERPFRGNDRVQGLTQNITHKKQASAHK